MRESREGSLTPPEVRQGPRLRRVALPWRAGYVLWPCLPPPPVLIPLVLYLGILGADWLQVGAAASAAARAIGIDPAAWAAADWILAALAAAVMAILIETLLIASSMAERTLRIRRHRLRRLDWLRRLGRRDRAWVIRAIRVARGARSSMHARHWPGAGVVSSGLEKLDPRRHACMPFEGEWIKRTGFGPLLSGADATGGLVLLLLGLVPVLLLIAEGSRGFGDKVGVVLLLGISAFGFQHWLVAAGLLVRGWFDAHVDAGAIEFAGPWRDDSFDRDGTIVYLTKTGPFVDAVFVNRSGRRARLLLSKHGAERLLAVWSSC